MRRKWTWDKVVRGSRGINCTGHCAWNVYVRNGIVWREEQQGEYGRSGEDTPDYGPRGCQKGARHAKHMYGKQRVLYPMKRVGERGAGAGSASAGSRRRTRSPPSSSSTRWPAGPDSITYRDGHRDDRQARLLRGAVPLRERLRHRDARDLRRRRRPAGRRLHDARLRPALRHHGRGVQVEVRAGLAVQPGGDAHPRRALLLGGEVQRHRDRDDRAGLQRHRDPLLEVAAPQARHRRRAGDVDGAGDPRRGPHRARLRARADRPAVPGARGRRQVPARQRPRRAGRGADAYVLHLGRGAEGP
jgi:hypothetical protein